MSDARFFPGFSLIELLIVITISLLLVGGTIAALGNYTDKRSVGSAAEELKIYFQSAQAKAKSGDLGGCDQLTGYRVQTYLVGSTIETSLQAVCGAGTADGAQVNTLPVGVTVSPNLDLVFQVLNAGVVIGNGTQSELEITVSNGTNTYLFTLFREGRVSEGAWQ